jgi:hypothetical protein
MQTQTHTSIDIEMDMDADTHEHTGTDTYKPTKSSFIRRNIEVDGLKIAQGLRVQIPGHAEADAICNQDSTATVRDRQTPVAVIGEVETALSQIGIRVCLCLRHNKRYEMTSHSSHTQKETVIGEKGALVVILHSPVKRIKEY